MKLLFLLALVISINTVKSQSTAEILNRCQFISGYYLQCDKFHHTYLPYTEGFKQATYVNFYGTFSELIIDPAYENLDKIYIYSTNLQKFEFKNYANFTKLNDLTIRSSEQAVNVNFAGAEKLKRLTSLSIWYNKMLNYSCESLKSSNLEGLSLMYNNLDSFDFSCLPNTMKDLYLEEDKLLTLHSLDSLKNLSTLTRLTLDLNPITHFNLGYLPKNIKYLYTWNAEAIGPQSCETMKNLSNLDTLGFITNKFTDFNFTCIPQNLVELYLLENRISTISDESCQFLKNHTSLRVLDLESNRLDYFQFGCLPTSITTVNLEDNNISEITDLTDIPQFNRVTLKLMENPIICTCSLLRDFVQLLDSGNVRFISYNVIRRNAFSCDNEYSELADYPWNNNAAAIKLHDASALGCLTDDNNTDNGNAGNTGNT